MDENYSKTKKDLLGFVHWLKNEKKLAIDRMFIDDYLYLAGHYDEKIKELDNKVIGKERLRRMSTRTRNTLIKNQTKHETIFKAYLKSGGYVYEFQKVFIVGNTRPYYYIVDFCLPQFKIIFEIDGEDHSLKKKYEADKTRDAWLKCNGYDVIRIKNSQLTDTSKCLELISSVLIPKKVKRPNHLI